MAGTRILSTIGILAALALGAGAAAARDSSDGLRLHVQGHAGANGSGLDVNVAWDPSKEGSPFHFTADACDDIAVGRLRKAWTALSAMPEGRPVTIETNDETIRATRQSGFLVLEPRREDRDDHHTRIKIPDYIVRSILDHDGRLDDRDVDRLVRERGSVTLVKVNSDVGGVTVWIDRSGARSD